MGEVASEKGMFGENTRLRKKAVPVAQLEFNGRQTDHPEQYKSWLRNEHNVELPRVAAHYDSVTRKICADVEASSCWQALLTNIGKMDQAYLVKTSYKLFVEGSPTPRLPDEALRVVHH